MIEISANYWENLFGVLLAFALLALTIERALYQIFDSKLWGLIEKKAGRASRWRLHRPEALDFRGCLRDNYPSPQSGLHRGRP